MLRSRLELRRVTQVLVRPAASTDLPAVLALLGAAGLPEDVEAHFASFLVAEDDGSILGSVGAESYGRDALLRSLVVAPDRRHGGLGSDLAERMLAHLRDHDFERVFLLTMDAGAFFERLGFRDIGRDEAPLSIRETREFRELCPATARLMRLEIP